MLNTERRITHAADESGWDSALMGAFDKVRTVEQVEAARLGTPIAMDLVGKVLLTLQTHSHSYAPERLQIGDYDEETIGHHVW